LIEHQLGSILFYFSGGGETSGDEWNSACRRYGLSLKRSETTERELLKMNLKYVIRCQFRKLYPPRELCPVSNELLIILTVMQVISVSDVNPYLSDGGVMIMIRLGIGNDRDVWFSQMLFARHSSVCETLYEKIIGKGNKP
jgi:hypothetical protein